MDKKMDILCIINMQEELLTYIHTNPLDDR